MKNAAVVYSATERQGSVLPYFFLDRYTDSYRGEWQAFVQYAREVARLGQRRGRPRTGSDRNRGLGVLSFGDSRHSVRRLITENDAHARHGFPIRSVRVDARSVG